MIRGSLIWFLLVAGLLVAVAIGWFALPARQWVEAFDAWIAALGPWGVVLFALAYVVVVVLLRLNPLVPFNLQNYFFGATEVGFLPYMVATFFGIMPGAAFYVYLGTLGREAGSGGAGAARWILLGAGLALTALVLFLIIRRANARLTELGIARTIGRGGR